jgi:hypothetical protein
MTHALAGGCHCGRVRVTLETARTFEELVPRACDCAFCRKHGAAWLSDPLGQLHVETQEARGLRAYRQGSENADMLLCVRCGVLVAVVFEHDDGVFGAINAACLEGIALPASVVVSPQRLSAAEKIERWRALWARAWVSSPHRMPADA